MIPCRICGRHAENHWVIGFPPAPDSQKMGLCPMHDNEENRAAAVRAWGEFMRERLDAHNRLNAERGKAGPQLLSIFFQGGSSISLPCLEASSDLFSLQARTPKGETLFFPMTQIRFYSLTPYTGPEAPELEG